MLLIKEKTFVKNGVERKPTKSGTCQIMKRSSFIFKEFEAFAFGAGGTCYQLWWRAKTTLECDSVRGGKGKWHKSKKKKNCGGCQHFMRFIDVLVVATCITVRFKNSI